MEKLTQSKARERFENESLQFSNIGYFRRINPNPKGDRIFSCGEYEPIYRQYHFHQTVTMGGQGVYSPEEILTESELEHAYGKGRDTASELAKIFQKQIRIFKRISPQNMQLCAPTSETISP